MPYQSPGVYVEEVPSSVKPITGVSTSTPVFIGIFGDTVQLVAQETDPAKTATAKTRLVDQGPLPASKSIAYFSNWSRYAETYGGLVGDSSKAANTSTLTDPAKASNSACHKLSLAVFGYFNNGGGGCYVVRVSSVGELQDALTALEAIDDISLVVAPGLTDEAMESTIRAPIVAHCSKNNCFAIFDGPAASGTGTPKLADYGATDYAAIYFPWIQVFDPAAALDGGDGIVPCPPSGHVAGVYGRIDSKRGVHKAPANEAIYGALGVTQALSKFDPAQYNPDGINCLRTINGNVVIWGARTLGGDKNAELKYINVRRTLIYLRKSIEDGTQWIVFEPNTPALWQKINRNIGAFLTEVWRSGALFGATAKEAFYVKCDSETNPDASVLNGNVVTEIGVALARPAEFVIFRISQYSGS